MCDITSSDTTCSLAHSPYSSLIPHPFIILEKHIIGKVLHHWLNTLQRVPVAICKWFRNLVMCSTCPDHHWQIWHIIGILLKWWKEWKRDMNECIHSVDLLQNINSECFCYFFYYTWIIPFPYTYRGVTKI